MSSLLSTYFNHISKSSESLIAYLNSSTSQTTESNSATVSANKVNEAVTKHKDWNDCVHRTRMFMMQGKNFDEAYFSAKGKFLMMHGRIFPQSFKDALRSYFDSNPVRITDHDKKIAEKALEIKNELNRFNNLTSQGNFDYMSFECQVPCLDSDEFRELAMSYAPIGDFEINELARKVINDMPD